MENDIFMVSLKISFPTQIKCSVSIMQNKIVKISERNAFV